MKRSSSSFEDLSSPSPEAPNTPEKTKASKTGESGTPSPKKKQKAAKEVQGEWTPEKKSCVIDELIAAGVEKLGCKALAEKYGVTVTQMRNATQAGRKGNLRDKAVQAVHR